MKRHIIILLFMILWNYSCSQEKKEKIDIAQIETLTSKVKDKEFLIFLNNFRNIHLPINYKKEIQKVKNGEYQLRNMTEYDAKKYFKKKENELYCNYEDYNYDTDEKTYRKEKNLPVYHLKYICHNNILVIHREGKGIDNDTSFVILSTFNFQGKRIDSALIGGKYTRENDWISPVILNENEFKVFRYEVNWENMVIKNGSYSVKDKEAPLSTVIIEDYTIDGSGKISKVKEYPKQYLKDDILKYKTVYPGSDDPMNKY